jgi:hypothetical protein
MVRDRCIEMATTIQLTASLLDVLRIWLLVRSNQTTKPQKGVVCDKHKYSAVKINHKLVLKLLAIVQLYRAG